MNEDEIDAFVGETLGRPIVVVGASTGSDTHSVGIDAMLNLKGYDGHHGLEGYEGFDTHNLGSQVPNTVLVDRAMELDADAILVSQTVTQQNLHIHNLTELVEMVEAEGMRDRTTLVCGGPRVSNELAKELGFDAGFSRGTYPNHLATFLVREPPRPRPRRNRPSRGMGEMSATLAAEVMPARRVTLVGLAKNTGKTEALTTLAAEVSGQGHSLGITSIGRDGEESDVIEPRIVKPRIHCPAGTLVATTAPLLRSLRRPRTRCSSRPA